MTPLNVANISHSMGPHHEHRELEHLNGSVVKVAVNDSLYPWHAHPNSDELFLMVAGELDIEFKDQATVTLGVGDLFKIPAGVIHQTRPKGRAVNLLFEAEHTVTHFVDAVPSG